MANTIGIDFGTTKTMVSYFNPATGRAELVRLGRDRDSIPTTVHEDESGAILFGEDADDQIETDPEGYCRAFKLHLGEKEPVLSRSDETAESLTARFLRHVKDECEQSVFHGGSVDSATITIPVAFAPARMASLKRAASSAGFSSVVFLPEPEAAGTAFLRDNPADSFSRALVLDWGGGTLDIAIISRDKDGTIHADRHCAEGRDDVGGEEMDRGLLVRLDEQWREAFGSPLLSSEENEPQLLREAEKIKIGLSRKEVVAFRRGPKKIDVDRGRFEQVVSGLVDAAVALVQSALEANEARGGQPPDAIILIGGTSQAPVVRKAMEKHFPELRVLSWHHSHEAVALGATSLSGKQQTPHGVNEPKHVAGPLSETEVDNRSASENLRPESRIPVPSNVSTKIPDGVPEAFEPAWRMPDGPLSVLGSVKNGRPIAYFGFGAEDEALEMEKGLLVHRKRLNRFEVVPFPEESETPIDIWSPPTFNGVELNDIWSVADPADFPDLQPPTTFIDPSASLPYSGQDTETADDAETCPVDPFSEPEREAFAELLGSHSDLTELQSEFDWFRSNSKDGYSSKRRNLSAQLAQCEDDRTTAEAELDRVRKEGGKGVFSFSGIKASWKASGLESKIAKIADTVKSTLEEINAIDAESKRHENWPLSVKTEELLQKERAHHEAYLEYCRVRYFRNRWKNEIAEERKVLDGLKVEISALQESARQTAEEIDDMEKRLPVLKDRLAETRSTAAEKTKEHESSFQLLASRARALLHAFDNGKRIDSDAPSA